MTEIKKQKTKPSAIERFEELNKFGVKWAKKKGLKEKDVERMIHEARGLKASKIQVH